eukprot:SAG31_NODE_10581_length_1121_cov_2.277886_2_plen_62_part_00
MENIRKLQPDQGDEPLRADNQLVMNWQSGQIATLQALKEWTLLAEDGVASRGIWWWKTGKA